MNLPVSNLNSRVRYECSKQHCENSYALTHEHEHANSSLNPISLPLPSLGVGKQRETLGTRLTNTISKTMEVILCNPFPIKKTTYIMHYILIFFLLLLNNKHSLKKYFNNYHLFSGLPWQKTSASLLFLGDDPILELKRKLAYETLTLGLLQKCAICLRSAYRKTLKS